MPLHWQAGQLLGWMPLPALLNGWRKEILDFNTGVARVPIVPAAILFDLGLGSGKIRPDAEMGYAATAAASKTPPDEGNYGAGTGASVGKIFGKAGAMKAGLGTASIQIGGGIIVGAIVAVNAFGDVIDPNNGEIIAGARTVKVGRVKIGGGARFVDTQHVLKSFAGRQIMRLRHRGKHCNWSGGSERKPDKGANDKSRTDGTGWIGTDNSTSTYHAGWGYHFCSCHRRTESRCQHYWNICCRSNDSGNTESCQECCRSRRITLVPGSVGTPLFNKEAELFYSLVGIC